MATPQPPGGPAGPPRAEYVHVELAENLVLGPGTFVLRFSGCEFLAGALPGQFVMLRADDWHTDPLLPRAFSLLDVRTRAGQTSVDILIKASGKASAMLEHALPGARFSILGPLGSSFATPSPERTDWLIAGGVGLAPLYMQMVRARAEGLSDRVTLFYGGRSTSDLVMLGDLEAAGCRVVLATDDGSTGFHGRVTEAVRAELETCTSMPTILACGPDPMLMAAGALARQYRARCYLSLEGEMACGIGVCLVCAVRCHGVKPFRYACTDGPVFDLDDLAAPYGDAA